MRTTRGALALVLLGAAAGCTHVQRVEGLQAELERTPGGFVQGEVSGLERVALLDNKDFVYAIALSDSGRRAALTRLAGKTFNLAVWALEAEPRRLADVETNDYAFDVEGLAFSPDGEAVATAGRDGVVRFFSATDGKLLGQVFTEEPLTAVAFHPSGRQVIAGSARGLLTVLSYPEGAYASELRAHADEVRAIAITQDGRVVTGGWDKTLAVFTLEQGQLSGDEVRLSVGETPAPTRTPVVRAALNGRMGLFAYDAAVPFVVVSAELAKAAGIDPSLLTESARVLGQDARVARGQKVQLKQLTVEGVDVAVCDGCLPRDAHGLLGAPVLGRFELSKSAAGELVLVAKQKQGEGAALPVTWVLKEQRRHTFLAFINDLSVDRAGARAGVAFSHDKAERTREIYQREKRGEPAPLHEDDAGAIVSLEDGAVLKKWRHHQGVVSTAAISPDGRALATGGWDKRLYLHRVDEARAVAQEQFGWSLRRVRFSKDGRLLAVGAWTPQNAVGSQQSDPSAVVYEVLYRQAQVVAK